MWDVFICHASEDKESLVRPLAKQLEEIYKVKVWYDEFSLELGDSLLDSIEKGLQESQYGVVVLSESFFEKEWTNHEYKSLRTKEMFLSKKVIIPIWYKIDKAQVAKYSLTLADKVAISVNEDYVIDELAVNIIKVVRSDIYNNISRMHYFEEVINKAIKAKISNDEILNIPKPPIRHLNLTALMKSRLKLVYYAIKDVDDRNYDEYEGDFRRSTNIDREIIITECLAAAYVDSISMREMSIDEKKECYEFIFTHPFAKADLNLTLNNNEIELMKEYIQEYTLNINTDIVAEYKFSK